jgi:hypothetical protein
MPMRRSLPLCAIVLVGCGPAPAAVCDHMIDLTRRELGKAAAADLDQDACVAELERQRARRGDDEHRRHVQCVLASDSFAELAACR